MYLFEKCECHPFMLSLWRDSIQISYGRSVQQAVSRTLTFRSLTNPLASPEADSSRSAYLCKITVSYVILLLSRRSLLPSSNDCFAIPLDASLPAKLP